MFVISHEVLELIKKADNGCIRSQRTVGTFYLGSKYLPKDEYLSSYYLNKFFEIPYHLIRFRGYLEPEYYMPLMIRHAQSLLIIGEYLQAMEFCTKAKNFANEFVPKHLHKELYEINLYEQTVDRLKREFSNIREKAISYQKPNDII